MASLLKLGTALPWSQLQWIHTGMRVLSINSISEFSTVAVARESDELSSRGEQVTSQPSTSGRGGSDKRKRVSAGGPPIWKVTTSEPWPWVVPMLPQVMPKLIKRPQMTRLPITEAVEAIKANAAARKAGTPELFQSGRPRPQSPKNESVEVIINFLTDPRKSDQLVRGVVTLPHGTGQTVRVAAFCTGADAEAAKAAGADVVGGEELITAIIESNGEAIKFDRLVAVPAMMKPLARAGRVLGPLGLMPNPKMGTLTPDIVRAVKEMRAGRLEFRVSPKPILQMVIGKASFPSEHIVANAGALLDALLGARPAVLPGNGLPGYMKSIFLKTSMTPSVAVDLKSAAALAGSIQQAAEQAEAAPSAAPAAPAAGKGGADKDKPKAAAAEAKEGVVESKGGSN